MPDTVYVKIRTIKTTVKVLLVLNQMRSVIVRNQLYSQFKIHFVLLALKPV